ncbi:MAG: hypothetical protein GX053_04770 [Tissierella sp.]|nr:hypothetical protein [Tissierella sp.]
MSYFFIEIMWRGYSHIGMFVLGGLCFILIGLISEYYFKPKGSLIILLIISSLVITFMELIFGLILNLVFKLEIWDYSTLKYNFIGQICLRYSIYWFFLSLPAILFYDYIRYWLFGENKPKYKFI